MVMFTMRTMLLATMITATMMISAAQVEEFFLKAGSEGGTVVDLSCGSGLMTRRLVASEK